MRLSEAEESRRILQVLMDHVPEGITIADTPDGRIRMVSRYGQDVLGGPHHGLTAEEVAGSWKVYFKDGIRLMPSEDLPLLRAIRRGETISGEEIMQMNAKGKRLSLLCSAAPIRDNAGTILGGIVAWRNITEMRKTQDALRESEERYRTLFTSMREGFALGEVVFDENGKPNDFRFIEINDALEQETGLSPSILGKPMTEVLPNLERYWIDAFSGVAMTGKPVRFGNYNKDTARHYDVYCYSPAKGRFAILFRDVTKEKQTEEVLRKRSQELEKTRMVVENEKLRLEAVMEALPAGVAITNARGGNIDFNRAYEEVWGGPPPPAPSVEDNEAYKAWWAGTGRIVEPEEWASAVAVQKGEAVRDQLLEIQRFDGSRAFVINSAAPVRDAAGNIIGSAVAIQDITALRKTENDLRESEKRFRALAESMPNLVWTCTSDGACDFLSRQWIEYTGISEAEQLGFEWLNQVHPEDREGLTAAWRKAVEMEEPFDAEFRIRRHDGVWRWFKARALPVRDENGRTAKWYGSNTDIEELKQGERALRDSEARLKLLSDTASQLLRSTEPQKLVNSLCLQVMEHLQCHVFFNFLVDEQAGRLHLNAFAGIPEEEAGKIEWLDYGVAVCGCVAQEGERIIAEDIFRTSDVRTDLVKPFGIQAYCCHPLMVGERLIGTLSFGTKTRTHFSSEDLALMKTVADQVAVAMERMRLIEQLRASRDELEIRVAERTTELERRNQELRDFAFVASHDLQEPLRKVQTFGDMLVRKFAASLGPEGRDYLQRMQRATARMQKLLESLLSYSRVTTKAEALVPTDLEKSVQSALSNLEIMIREKNARVTVGHLPTVEADRPQMIQLFQNLVANALKFQKESAIPRVNIYSREGRSGRAHEILVEDNGIGFEEKYVDKIFMPFQRLHGRSGYEGVGMGLAICKKIVERHGGQITARSEKGKGSTFIVTLLARRKKR